MSAYPLAALGVGAMGALAGLATQAVDAGSEVTPWLSGGGVATLAGVLLYLLKQFLQGNLMSRQIAELLQEQAVMIAAMGEREDRLQAALLDSKRREERLAKRLEDSNRVLWRATDVLEGKKRP